MSKKFSKVIQDVRKTIKFLPSRKSFSLPKKFGFKPVPIQNVHGKIEREIDYETSYVTVNTNSITSLDDDTDFYDDSCELEHSSIETARSAAIASNAFYPNSSCDVLVNKKSMVIEDFSSDPSEFFHQNHPIAASTPKNSPIAPATPKNHSQAFLSSFKIKNPSEFFHQNHPIAASTPKNHSQAFLSSFKIKNYITCDNSWVAPATPKPNWRTNTDDEYKKMKSFMDFSEQESTIIEPAKISLILPAIKDYQEAKNPDLEVINESLLFLNSPIPEIAELSKCNSVVLTAHDAKSTNRVISNIDSKLKTKGVGYAFQETHAMEKDPICNTNSKEKKHLHKAKRFKSIPICLLTLAPKCPKPASQQSRSVKENRKATNPGKYNQKAVKDIKKHVCQAKNFENIPICILTLPPKQFKPVSWKSRTKIKRNKKNEVSVNKRLKKTSAGYI